jgi:hypothetical protein
MAASLRFLGLVLLLAAGQCPAAVTIVFRETGGNVVADVSGILNVTSLGAPLQIMVAPGLLEFLAPGDYSYVVGPSAVNAFLVTFPVQQPLHGTPVSYLADQSTGGTVGVNFQGAVSELFVPRGYVSGAPITGSSTWNGDTFASLGLVPGTYRFNFGADSVTFVVGGAAAPASVPAIDTLGMLFALLGFVLIAGWKLRAAADA